MVVAHSGRFAACTRCEDLPDCSRRSPQLQLLSHLDKKNRSEDYLTSENSMLKDFLNFITPLFEHHFRTVNFPMCSS